MASKRQPSSAGISQVEEGAAVGQHLCRELPGDGRVELIAPPVFIVVAQEAVGGGLRSAGLPITEELGGGGTERGMSGSVHRRRLDQGKGGHHLGVVDGRLKCHGRAVGHTDEVHALEAERRQQLRAVVGIPREEPGSTADRCLHSHAGGR